MQASSWSSSRKIIGSGSRRRISCLYCLRFSFISLSRACDIPPPNCFTVSISNAWSKAMCSSTESSEALAWIRSKFSRRLLTWMCLQCSPVLVWGRFQSARLAPPWWWHPTFGSATNWRQWRSRSQIGQFHRSRSSGLNLCGLPVVGSEQSGFAHCFLRRQQSTRPVSDGR